MWVYIAMMCRSLAKNGWIRSGFAIVLPISGGALASGTTTRETKETENPQNKCHHLMRFPMSPGRHEIRVRKDGPSVVENPRTLLSASSGSAKNRGHRPTKRNKKTDDRGANRPVGASKTHLRDVVERLACIVSDPALRIVQAVQHRWEKGIQVQLRGLMIDRCTGAEDMRVSAIRTTSRSHRIVVQSRAVHLGDRKPTVASHVRPRSGRSVHLQRWEPGGRREGVD